MAEPPRKRLYYGWVMIPVSFAVLLVSSPGQTFVISCFNDSFRHDLGLTHTQLTLAYMLGTLLSALPMPWIGGFIDRRGSRRTTAIAACLLGLICLLTARVNSLATLFLAFLLLRATGQGVLSLISTNVLAMWFHRRLGLATGLRYVAMDVAIAVLPMVVLFLIHGYGWRTTYVIFGCAVWLIMLPLVLTIFRNKPEDVGELVDGGPADETAEPVSERDFTLAEAAQTRGFWILCACLGLWAALGTAVYFNIQPLLQWHGLPATESGSFWALFAIILACFQLAGGIISDRFPERWVLAGSMLALSAAMAMMRFGSAHNVVVGIAALLGISQGLFTSCYAPIYTRYFGRPNVGRIQGALSTLMVASSAFGPFAVGFARDLLGGYEQVFDVLIFLPLPLFVLAFWGTAPEYPPASRAALTPTR